MYTTQQQLEYLHKIQRIQQANILKDDIHLTYIYRNKNKAVNRVHTLQDKIQMEIVQEVLDGEYPNQHGIRKICNKHDLEETVNDILTENLTNERKRVHKDDSRFVDHVVENYTQQYSKFLANRINIEAGRIIDKAIIIEGQALENGASHAEARKAVLDYAKTHGKARTRNIIKDAMHSQEVNIGFIKALDEGWRYKIWCNGNKRNNTRAWHIYKTIPPVLIEDAFTIAGPYGIKDSMFPGDLNSGAENVANCKCYLRYSNRKPSGFGKQTVYNVPSTSYLNRKDEKRTNFNVKDKIKNTTEKISSKVSDTTNKIKSKFNDISSTLRNKFKFRR